MESPLSDKAKGKRKATIQGDGDEAYDALESQSLLPSTSGGSGVVDQATKPPPVKVPLMRTFTLRFSEGGLQDLRMTISTRETVRDVERRVESLPLLSCLISC